MAAEEVAAVDSRVRDSHHPNRLVEAPQGAAEECREKELGGVAAHEVVVCMGLGKPTITPTRR